MSCKSTYQLKSDSNPSISSTCYNRHKKYWRSVRRRICQLGDHTKSSSKTLTSCEKDQRIDVSRRNRRLCFIVTEKHLQTTYGEKTNQPDKKSFADVMQHTYQLRKMITVYPRQLRARIARENTYGLYKRYKIIRHQQRSSPVVKYTDQLGCGKN